MVNFVLTVSRLPIMLNLPKYLKITFGKNSILFYPLISGRGMLEVFENKHLSSEQ